MSFYHHTYEPFGDAPMLCGRCFDDLMFEGRPEARAAAEAHRDEVLAWVVGNA